MNLKTKLQVERVALRIKFLIHSLLLFFGKFYWKYKTFIYFNRCLLLILALAFPPSPNMGKRVGATSSPQSQRHYNIMGIPDSNPIKMRRKESRTNKWGGVEWEKEECRGKCKKKMAFPSSSFSFCDVASRRICHGPHRTFPHSALWLPHTPQLPLLALRLWYSYLRWYHPLSMRLVVLLRRKLEWRELLNNNLGPLVNNFLWHLGPPHNGEDSSPFRLLTFLYYYYNLHCIIIIYTVNFMRGTGLESIRDICCLVMPLYTQTIIVAIESKSAIKTLP